MFFSLLEFEFKPKDNFYGIFFINLGNYNTVRSILSIYYEEGVLWIEILGVRIKYERK